MTEQTTRILPDTPDPAMVHALIESTKIMLAFTDLDFTCTWVNPALADGFGRLRESLVGRSLLDLFPAEEDKALFSRVRDTGISVSIDAKPFTSPGPDPVVTFRDLRLYRLPDAGGLPAAIVLSLADVTSRALAERERERLSAELAESAMKYRIVADHTIDWEFWIAPDRRYVYCSPSCERITGRPRESFTADPDLLEKITHPEDREMLSTHMHETLEKEASGKLTFRIVLPDGSVRWIEHLCNPVRDGEGRYLGTRGSNRDITGRIAEETSLRAAERYESVGRLAGGVAHKINNLMTVVLGYSSALQRALPKDDPSRVAFEEIEKAGEHTAEIVGRLLSYSRHQLYAPRTVEAGGLLIEMRKRLEAVAGSRGTLELEASPAPHRIHVDVEQFRRTLEELVGNARDALGPDGGRIVVRCGSRRVKADDAAAMGIPIRPGTYVVVEVADNGRGMEPAMLSAVLTPFTTTKEMGRGLGLPSCYGFVRQSDGYIHLASAPGAGTTASLFFPESPA